MSINLIFMGKKNSNERNEILMLSAAALAAAGALALKLSDSPQLEEVSSDTREEAMRIVQDVDATQSTPLIRGAGSGIAEAKLADLQK